MILDENVNNLPNLMLKNKGSDILYFYYQHIMFTVSVLFDFPRLRVTLSPKLIDSY